MKDFFKYFLIGIIVLPVLFLCSNVKALTWSSKYRYCSVNATNNYSESCYATNWRTGSDNKITLFGYENYSPTYDKFESFTGSNNYIDMEIVSGNTYTFTFNYLYTNLSSEEFTYNTLNRYKDNATTDSGTITNVSYSYTNTNECNSFYGTTYCNYIVSVVYTLTANRNTNRIYLGSYSDTGQTFGLYEHYLESQVSLFSISYFVNNDNTITNQNQTIINNTNNINNNINNVNDNINNLNDNISDDNVSGAESELNNVINNNAFNDNSGLSSIISMPLTLVNGLSSTCQPISITIPYMNYDFTIPCISSILSSKVPTIYTTLKIVINGVIIYFVLLDMYRIIKNAKNPDDDRIEVLDL